MNPRDHGLADPGTPISKPVARAITDKEFQAAVDAADGCPNCGCETIMEITLQVEMPMLKGGKGTGRYLGCPACPWASPMITIATGSES